MKKGFTLVELIVTIGLISILGLIIVMNMASNLTKQTDEQYELFKKTLEDAACVYVDLAKDKSDASKDMKEFKKNCKDYGCEVELSTLLENGLIEEKDLKNPKEDTYQATNSTVHITYSSGIKTCKFE